MAGVSAAREDARKAAMSAAWHGAYWSRVEKFPPHDKAIGIVRAIKLQTASEAAANIRAWRIALGGKE